MTISRKNRLLLMCLASFKTDPEEFVFLTLSLPAKSTRWSFDRRILSLPFSRTSMAMVKMQWERDDAMFIGVSAMARFVSPMNNKFNASSSVSAGFMDRFLRWKFPCSSSRMFTWGDTK